MTTTMMVMTAQMATPQLMVEMTARPMLAETPPLTEGEMPPRLVVLMLLAILPPRLVAPMRQPMLQRRLRRFAPEP